MLVFRGVSHAMMGKLSVPRPAATLQIRSYYILLRGYSFISPSFTHVLAGWHGGIFMTGGWVDMRSDSCGFLLFSLLDTNMGPDPVGNGVKWGPYKWPKIHG